MHNTMLNEISQTKGKTWNLEESNLWNQTVDGGYKGLGEGEGRGKDYGAIDQGYKISFRHEEFVISTWQL